MFETKAGKRPFIGCTTYSLSVPPNYQVNGLMTSYIEAVLAAGGVPLLIPHGLTDGDLALLFSRLDGIVIPGGGDVHPDNYGGDDHATIRGTDTERDRLELAVARRAVEMEKPLLAICRGHQLLNVAMGGTLWADVRSQRSDSLMHDYFGSFPRNHLPHEVQVEPTSKLASLLGRTQTAVNSLHHQAVRELGQNLCVTAVAPDGVVEAIEVENHPFAIGVQWHPENLIHDDPLMLALFQGLVRAAGG